MKLSDYKGLTFDCYGTLIEWETGLYENLKPLAKQAGLSAGRDTILATFAKHEVAQQVKTPELRYADLLARVYQNMAQEWTVHGSDSDAEAFGQSVPTWPAFPDSVKTLGYLKQHYKLIILSNVDRTSFAGSNKRL